MSVKGCILISWRPLNVLEREFIYLGAVKSEVWVSAQRPARFVFRPAWFHWAFLMECHPSQACVYLKVRSPEMHICCPKVRPLENVGYINCSRAAYCNTSSQVMPLLVRLKSRVVVCTQIVSNPTSGKWVVNLERPFHRHYCVRVAIIYLASFTIWTMRSFGSLLLQRKLKHGACRPSWKQFDLLVLTVMPRHWAPIMGET